MAAIPLSWNDPIFSGVTTSASITVKNGGTVTNKSITDSGDMASIVGVGSFTLEQVRINSREGVRIGGDGNVVINQSYIETTGVGADHADGIQAYSPGSSGNLTITNSTIVSHNSSANAGLFIADNYGGSVTLNNVVFQGGPIGLRIAADNQDVTVALKDVYFVGPFMYEPLLIQEVNADVHITQWENVRYATIVNGELVPGALIASPFPVEGGAPTSPPVEVIAPDIASWSPDSGKTGDGVTNAEKIILTGSAAANSTITILDGTKQIGSTKTDASGQWTYTGVGLTEGSHKFSVTATTSAGTSSASAVKIVVVDTTAPVAPTLKVSTSAATLASSPVAVLAGAAEANSTVKVYDGTVQIGTASANANGAWTFTTSNLATGNHSFTAKAMDAAGNTGNGSAAVSVSIAPSTSSKPTAPTITTISDDSGVKGDGITNDNTLTLTGTAAANSTVKIYDGSTQIGSVKAGEGGAWSYTTSPLTDAKHSLTATSTNSSGQTSDSSAVVTTTIDTKAPNAPTLGVFSSDGKALSGTTAVDDVLLKGNAEANSSVKVYDAGKLIGSATVNGDGTWSYDAGQLSNGDHKFAAIATDAAGNASATSAAAPISVIDQPISSVELINLFQSSNNGVVIKGAADAYSQIQIFDGTKTIGTVEANADGDWYYASGWVSPASVHTFSASEVNDSGQVVASSGSAIVGSWSANTLKGTSADDILVGNGGTDTFVFEPNFGNDIIKDFRAYGGGHDVVQFSKSVFDCFADVLSHATQNDQDVVIAVGDDTLTLKNTKIGALDRGDFQFA